MPHRYEPVVDLNDKLVDLGHKLVMNKKLNYLVLGLSAFMAVGSPVLAQTKAPVKKIVGTPAVKAAPAQQGLIPNDPNVKIGKLPNGLTYYIRKNSEPKNRAELYLATRIGSLMEEDDQQGLAHFTEHMAFNGTRDFPKNEMINYLQRAGVRFGADLNAYTGFDQTVYQLPIPTDSTAVFKNGFKILANWAGGIIMEAEEIDKERGVIVEEERQRGKNAQERMSKHLLPVLLHGSRYAERLPIGKTDILLNFKHERLRSFYRDWYRPDLQAVIAVGDFDLNEAEQLIKTNFSGLSNPVNQKKRPEYGLPDNKEPLVKVVTDPEQQYNVAMVIYKQRGEVSRTTAAYRKKLTASLVNSMLQSRLQEILDKGNAPFVYAQSSFGPYQGGMVKGISAFQTFAVAATGGTLLNALDAALAENERAAKFGFLQSELDVARKNMLATADKQLREKDKTPSSAFVQQYLNNFLTGAAIPSIEFISAETKRVLDNLTLAEVNQAVKGMITKENRIIIVQAPEKDKSALPTDAQLLAAVNNAGKGVTAYVDNSLNRPLLDKLPVAGKIVSQRQIASVGVTELTLSNGIKVLLKPTDFKNDQVLFFSFAKGGNSLAADADLPSAQMAGLINQSGVGVFNPTQLNKLLAGNTARAGSYIDELYQGFSGSASPKDLETAFQLVYAFATNPRKDLDIFNKNISDYRVMMANKNADPNSVFGDTVQAVLNGYHKRAMPMGLTDLDKISLDKIYDFYRARFADNGAQTFVITGSIDTVTIRPMIEKYLGGLPASGTGEEYKDQGVRTPKGKIEKTVYKGLEDKASVQLYLHGDYVFNTENNTQLDALKAALENKILERLREKESGVYSPRVNLSVEKLPDAHYYFTISFSCAPANVDKLIAAALDEVGKIREKGATQDDINKFSSEEQRQIELSLRDNNFWMHYLANRMKYGEDFGQILDYRKRLEAVTVESTKAAAKQYLGAENYIRLVLMPQKKN